MTEAAPWFQPPWIPGLVVGVLCLLFGVLVAVVPSHPSRYMLMRSLYLVLVALSAGLVLLGVAALLAGQPQVVWENAFTAGTVAVIIMLASWSAVKRFRP